MILETGALLNAAEIAFLRGLYDQCQGRDGGLSAEAYAARVKHNRELATSPEQAMRVKGAVIAACNRLPFLASALVPKLISMPILSVYETGMAYGSHIDSAVAEIGGETFRSDLSCTIFLDDPATYDGGELFIETEYGERTFKLPAGHAVFYPTLFSHEVREVRRGQRRACIFWVQSLIRDPQRRMLLFELAQATSWLGREGVTEEEIRTKLAKVRENLYRMWLEG